MIGLPIEWTEFQIENNMVGVSFSGDQAALKSWRTLKGGRGRLARAKKIWLI